MKTKLLLAAGLVAFLGMASVRAASADELLEKGIYTEETKGELEAANQIYQQIVDDAKADQRLVAQAQLRLGLCQLKLGNRPKAISALERLTQEFPDKDKLLALLDDQMPALLEELVKQIEQNYIQEVDRSELVETAIRAIIGKLDARGGLLRAGDMEFLSTNALSELQVGLEQQIAGVGASLKTNQTGEIVVNAPLRNSPAWKAGIKPGDRIVQIDGVKLPVGEKLAEVVKRIRGPVGSGVRLTIKRLEQTLEFELTRDNVRLPSVRGDHYKADDTWDFMVDAEHKVGYVRLTQVGKQSPQEMGAALKELQSGGVKGLILDLRSNPGGSLSEAIAIADMFVESGTIVTVKGRSGEKVYEAKAEGTYGGFPMVLLVNHQTASAAEIIAACLQDHHRAVIIGERTFGQAIVRALFPLKSGVGSLKLPISTYYRPSGKNVNRFPGFTEADEWGVKPDEGHEVIVTEDEWKQYEIVRNVENPSEASKAEVRDRQLEKALAYLRAQQ
ncbi:MAG: Carboxyl-terminal protease [Verrucomicrobiales bacterium]|nr:Carboxyl-terminal protease [Verrucomicrobiales bacterium]